MDETKFKVALYGLCIFLSINAVATPQIIHEKDAELLLSIKDNHNKQIKSCIYGYACTLLVDGCGTASRFLTITNNSGVTTARNIKAYLPLNSGLVEDSNNCTSVAPHASCKLGFTASPLTVTGFTHINIPVYGSNTPKNYFNITASACGAATLSTSVSTLALSVNKVSAFNALTGTPRQITVTNSSPQPARNLGISYPAWPAGTSATSNCTTTLGSGASCIITVTPGANATTACNTGIAPTAGVVSISADNAATATTNVMVLDYGCIYQGGYVFAVNDTLPATGSISGLVVTTTSQASLIWSPDDFDIPGITETSVAPPCNGQSEGACNTQEIVTHYGILTSYAAGLCRTSISGYSDWYLPAICELGYTDALSVCGALPGIQQNIQYNINELSMGLIGNVSAWSSTEYSVAPATDSWSYKFSPDDAPFDGTFPKSNFRFVYCARALLQP